MVRALAGDSTMTSRVPPPRAAAEPADPLAPWVLAFRPAFRPGPAAGLAPDAGRFALLAWTAPPFAGPACPASAAVTSPPAASSLAAASPAAALLLAGTLFQPRIRVTARRAVPVLTAHCPARGALPGSAGRLPPAALHETPGPALGVPLLRAG